MPVKSKTLMSAAFLDSAARTASIQEAVAVVSACCSSALFRRYSLLPSYYNGKVMRFASGLVWAMCIGIACAQTPEDTDVVRAQAGIEKLRQLVDAGAAPRVELEQAEDALADAQDFSFLRKTLYGTD